MSSLFPPAPPRVAPKAPRKSRVVVFNDASVRPTSPPTMDVFELLRTDEKMPAVDDIEMHAEVRHLLGAQLYKALVHDDLFLLD
jgi:hypothetical protein